jgi:hypothetical protein
MGWEAILHFSILSNYSTKQSYWFSLKYAKLCWDATVDCLGITLPNYSVKRRCWVSLKCCRLCWYVTLCCLVQLYQITCNAALLCPVEIFQIVLIYVVCVVWYNFTKLFFDLSLLSRVEICQILLRCYAVLCGMIFARLFCNTTFLSRWNLPDFAEMLRCIFCYDVTKFVLEVITCQYWRWKWSYPCARHEGMWGRAGIPPVFLNLALDGVVWTALLPDRFILVGTDSDVHWIGDSGPVPPF